MTLVELMIAMVIGLMLIAGVGQMYVANKQVFRSTQALSQVQESGRFAFEYLTRDVRMADYWGCQVNTDEIKDRVDHGSVTGAYVTNWKTDAVKGVEGGASPDSLTLRGTFGDEIHVVQAAANNFSPLKVDAKKIDTGEVLVVTDCKYGDLFVASSSVSASATPPIDLQHTAGSGNASGNLSTTYGKEASVFRLGEVVFDVQTGSNGQRALFRTYNNGTPEEIVSGISDMQITYGIDVGSDGNIDWYGDATAVDAAAAWGQVVSIRIAITARSPEQNVSRTSVDTRMEQTYTTTISVRNRLG